MQYSRQECCIPSAGASDVGWVRGQEREPADQVYIQLPEKAP